ncbi:MAG: endolytic transglycosylase MltG [Baekduia sp.]
MTPLFGGKKGDGGAADRARSAAEREAARLERERRRAEREGRTPPPAPEPVAFEPEPEPVAWEPEPVAYDPIAEPGDQLPEPAYELPPEPVYASPAEPVAEPAWAPEPEPVTVPPEPFEPEHEIEPHTHVEAPAGVKRVSAPSVGDLPQVGGPRPTPPGPVRGPAGRRTRRRDRPASVPRQRGLPRSRRGARRLVLLLVLLLVAAAAWFAYRVAQPGHDAGDAKRPIAVVIAPGSTAGEIADELADQGVIDSAFFFNIRSRLSGKRGDLKAGRFTLKRDMSYAAALDALTQNPAAAPTVKVTIPEGLSISETAAIIRQTALDGSYLKAATRNPREVKGFKNYGVPRGTHSLEGFLFPATYELKRKSTARDLTTQQLATFKRTFDPLSRKAAHRKNLSDYDVLIIASMIEREAQVAKDRRLISAVIYNRLEQHIPLGIDATLRYILNNWSRPLKQSELQKNSAFNTRTRQGLPPTPIGSPGLASIKAALSPAKVNYLFYVVKPCGNGAHAFSATDAQFTKDVQAYNRKRAQLGGKDPSHC